MTTEANGIVGIVGLLAFILFTQGPWQTYCTDLARQLLFMERDALFDLAADGRITFDNPAYRAMRSQIEGHIRFAHEATWFRFLILALFFKRNRAAGNSRPSALLLIGQIEDADVRRMMIDTYNRCARITLRMIIQKSFVLTLIRAIGLLILGVLDIQEQLSRTILRRIVDTSKDLIQQEAGALKENRESGQGRKFRHA